jgi:dCMP deaminase
MRLNKTEYFMKITEDVSLRSTCLRRQVGAILVKDDHIIATGYNGVPKNIPHCETIGCLREKLNIPSGQQLDICKGLHAEQNVIIQAAKFGISTINSTLYCTHQPCLTCAKMIINADIKRIIYKNSYDDKNSYNLLKSANIILINYNDYYNK